MPALPIFERLKALGARAANGGGALPAFLRPPLPPLAVEVTPRAVRVLRLATGRGGTRIAGHSQVPLEPGVILPGLMRCGVAAPEALGSAIQRAAAGAGARPGRAALILPDLAARVTLSGVPDLPAAPAAAEELVRFRLRRTLPYRPEELALWWSRRPGPALAGEEGEPILAVVALRQIVEQYEDACTRAGLRVGLVSLATLEIANLVRADIAMLPGPHGALLNLSEESATLAIFEQGQPVFYRTKSLLSEDEAPRPADPAAAAALDASPPPAATNGGEPAWMRDLRRELSVSLAFFRDKLAGVLPLPLLVRADGSVDGDLTGLLSNLGFSPVQPIEPLRGIPFESASPATAPALAVRFAAPLGVTAGRRL